MSSTRSSTTFRFSVLPLPKNRLMRVTADRRDRASPSANRGSQLEVNRKIPTGLLTDTPAYHDRVTVAACVPALNLSFERRPLRLKPPRHIA